MRKFYTSILFVCLAALSMGAYVQPDPGGRDGWLIDTAQGDLLQMRAGVVVGRVSSAGVYTPTAGITLSGDLTLENGETIKNDNNGEIEFGDTVEDTAWSWGTNSLIYSSDTGVVEIDFGALATTLTFTNDGSLSTGVANTFTWLENGEDWVQTFNTNAIDHGTTTGVTHHDWGDIGVKTTNLIGYLDSAYFCGNAANATTSVFMPPLQEQAADMTTFVYGAAGCDGLDNTTEGSGDAVLNGNGALAINVFGIHCGISAAGTDDTYTWQLRDDGSDVTGITCNVTLDGSIQTCEKLLDVPVVMAAGSLMAIQSEADSNDDVSSADTECVIYYSQ